MKRPPLTIDELIAKLKEMRRHEGGDCPVFLCDSKQDYPVTHVAMDHYAIVLNG